MARRRNRSVNRSDGSPFRNRRRSESGEGRRREERNQPRNENDNRRREVRIVRNYDLSEEEIANRRAREAARHLNEIHRAENERQRRERERVMQREMDIARARRDNEHLGRFIQDNRIQWPPTAKNLKWNDQFSYDKSKPNFNLWFNGIQSYLDAAGMWLVVGKEIDYNLLCPADKMKYQSIDKQAVCFLMNTVDTDTYQMIKQKHGEKLFSWTFIDELRLLSKNNSLQNIQLLRSEFNNLRYKDGEDMMSFLSKLNLSASEIGRLETPPSDTEKACTLIGSLPDSWSTLKTLWLNTQPLISWSVLQAAVLAEANRRKSQASNTTVKASTNLQTGNQASEEDPTASTEMALYGKCNGLWPHYMVSPCVPLGVTT